MKLCIELDHSPGHIVFDGDPAPAQKGAHNPIFGPCLLWLNGWMDQDTIWYGGRPRPRRHRVRWDPVPRPSKRAQQLPSFRPMSIVAKRSPVSATAELLLNLRVKTALHVKSVDCWRSYKIEKYVGFCGPWCMCNCLFVACVVNLLWMYDYDCLYSARSHIVYEWAFSALTPLLQANLPVTH